MSKYLARLKALDFEKAPTSGTVKTGKSHFDGFDGGVGGGFQKSHGPFDGFDGGAGEGFQKSCTPFDGFDGFQDERIFEALSDDGNLKATSGATVKTDKSSRLPLAAIENLKAHTSGTVKTVKRSWQARAAFLEQDFGLQREWAEPFARLLCGGSPGDFDPAYWSRTLPGASTFSEQWAAQAYALGWPAEDVFGLDDVAPARRHDSKGVAWLLPDGKRVVALDAGGADIETARGVKQRFYRSN